MPRTCEKNLSILLCIKQSMLQRINFQNALSSLKYVKYKLCTRARRHVIHEVQEDIPFID